MERGGEGRVVVRVVVERNGSGLLCTVTPHEIFFFFFFLLLLLPSSVSRFGLAVRR